MRRQAFRLILFVNCLSFSFILLLQVLKSSNVSLWVRNVQICVTSIPLTLLLAYWRDGAGIAERGFNFGYTWLVWQVVLNQAIGGLLVAVVVKYADNLLKAFAAAISIISSTLIAAAFFNFRITPYFLIGTVLVLVSTYVYSVPESVYPILPIFLKEQPKQHLPV